MFQITRGSYVCILQVLPGYHVLKMPEMSDNSPSPYVLLDRQSRIAAEPKVDLYIYFKSYILLRCMGIPPCCFVILYEGE